MTMGQRIKMLRESANMSQADFGNIVGVSDKAVSTWENDLKIPRMGKIEKLANHFGVSKSYIIDGTKNKATDAGSFSSNIIPFDASKRIPILGRIAAGLPILAEQNIEGYTTTDLNGGAVYFGLRVKGDSMNAARINEGDVLIVRQQSEVENGQIAVVMVNGSEATVKRFYQTDNTVTLMPQSTNPEHRPQIYNTAETQVRVIGLVVKNEITF